MKKMSVSTAEIVSDNASKTSLSFLAATSKAKFFELNKIGSRKLVLYLLFSFCFASLQTLGETGPYGANISAHLALLSFPLWFIGSLIAIFVFDKTIYGRSQQPKIKEPSTLTESHQKRHLFLIAWILIVLPWIFNFLLMYPGCGTSDSASSMQQALGLSQLSNHHPVAFTAIVAIFLNIGNSLGNLEIGIALYSTFTLVFLSLVCAYTCYWIYSRTESRLALVCSVAFFTLNPIIGRYAITMWKDIYFSGLLLLTILAFADYARTKGAYLDSVQHRIYFAVIVLLTCIFRSNAPMVIVASFAGSLLLYKSLRRKTYIATISIPIVLSIIITGPFYSSLGIEKADTSEAFGLPIQQIANVVANDGEFSDDSRGYLSRLFDFSEIKDVYKPTLSNPVKWADSFDNEYLNSTKAEFLKVWVCTFPDNVSLYIKAWRDQTIGYWYPVDNWITSPSGYYVDESMDLYSSNSAHWPDELNNEGTSLIGFESIANALKNTEYDFVRLQPFLHPFFNIACMVWITLGAFTLMLANRNPYSLAILPLIALWLTMLAATPTYCEFRYMFAFHLALPLVISLLVFKPACRS